MQEVKPNGALIRRLRKAHPPTSKQVEFARRAGISDRQLRDYENDDRPIDLDLLKRFAFILKVPYQALLEQAPPATIAKTEPHIRPRYDTTFLRVVKDELELYTLVRRTWAIIPHILVPLNDELSRCAEELVEILRGLTHSLERPSASSDDPDFARRRRIRTLLVTLKGNDVWTFVDEHMKQAKESNEYQPDWPSEWQSQTIIAFGAPCEYGEETVTVPVDHGRPYMIRSSFRFSASVVPLRPGDGSASEPA